MLRANEQQGGDRTEQFVILTLSVRVVEVVLLDYYVLMISYLVNHLSYECELASR